MPSQIFIDEMLPPRVLQRRKAVARSRNWHDERRAARRPEPRNADGAIAEAAAFALAVPELTVPAVDVISLIEIATLILQRQGFTRIASRNLVIERLKPRVEHRDAFTLPNISGRVDIRLVRHPAGREWEGRDLETLASVVGRLRSVNDGVTGVFKGMRRSPNGS